MDWLATVSEATALTSITVGELLTGARTLPAGRRRTALLAAIEQFLASHADHILPYDHLAARSYAQFQEVCRAAGQPLSVEDGMTAAICATRGLKLATRNGKDFDGLGLAIIDPWAA